METSPRLVPDSKMEALGLVPDGNWDFKLQCGIFPIELTPPPPPYTLQSWQLR